MSGGLEEGLVGRLRTGIILRLIRQCRPRPGPVRIPSNAKTAKTANSWLLADDDRCRHIGCCRRCQRHLYPNQPPTLGFFFGHFGQFSAVSGNHRPSLLLLKDLASSRQFQQLLSLQVNLWRLNHDNFVWKYGKSWTEGLKTKSRKVAKHRLSSSDTSKKVRFDKQAQSMLFVTIFYQLFWIWPVIW